MTTIPPEKSERLRVVTLLQQLLAEIIARLSGEKCDDKTDPLATLPQDAAPAPARPDRVITWQSRSVEHLEEHEKTTVTACGTVKTADGREISFSLGLGMQRDFSCTRETETSGKIELKDPLVINFAGQAAELTERHFSFDLDADGTAELLPELAAGSGYLVFDADHDGKIADGRELFGATGQNTGNGFADLARYDADKNGWIDEADTAFSALGVWFPDGRIASLKDAGVGALSLASAASPFALKDEDNQLRGQITRTGIFLKENGEVGNLQQVDLATKAPAPN